MWYGDSWRARKFCNTCSVRPRILKLSRRYNFYFCNNSVRGISESREVAFLRCSSQHGAEHERRASAMEIAAEHQTTLSAKPVRESGFSRVLPGQILGKA